MKKIVFTFFLLLSVFFISWGVKANTMVTRPENLDSDGKITPWYESDYVPPDDDSEWYIDPNVPDRYIKMPGKDDIYMVTDENGQVVSYAKRVKNGNGYDFIACDNPNANETYEKVAGTQDVYKVTKEDGTSSYKKYVRNKDDNTFAFVDCDKEGNYTGLDTDATKVDEKTHKLVDSKNNIYALYNENNVKIGYQKRVKDKDGKYKWVLCDPPKETKKVGNDAIKQIGQGQNNQFKEDFSGMSEKSESKEPEVISEREEEGNGQYTMTQKETYTETKGEYRYTYQKTTKITYNADGTVAHMETSKPQQIGKEKVVGSASAPDQSLIQADLDKELARVTAQVSFDNKKASQILTKLNAARKDEGLPALKMDTSSDIYKTAQIRAADMAIYNYGTGTSPMYGNLESFCGRYQLDLVNPVQNSWKTTSRSASDIHNRMQSTDMAYSIRMSNGYGQVGIAVAQKDGKDYFIEVFAQ